MSGRESVFNSRHHNRMANHHRSNAKLLNTVKVGDTRRAVSGFFAPFFRHWTPPFRAWVKMNINQIWRKIWAIKRQSDRRNQASKIPSKQQSTVKLKASLLQANGKQNRESFSLSSISIAHYTYCASLHKFRSPLQGAFNRKNKKYFGGNSHIVFSL